MEQLRSDYERYMDGVATRVSEAVHGVEAGDVATICSVIAAYAIRTGHREPWQRDEAFDKITAMMRKVIEARTQ
jgi:hypothetical protein